MPLCYWNGLKQELKGGGGECREVTFFLWHTLHLPISAQADGGDRKGEKKGRVFGKENNVIKHKVSLSALRLIWQSLKLKLLSQMDQGVCKYVTLCAVWRASRVGFQFSVQLMVSCDSPGPRGTEGHLSWLWHPTHGITVTLRPEEKVMRIFWLHLLMMMLFVFKCYVCHCMSFLAKWQLIPISK